MNQNKKSLSGKIIIFIGLIIILIIFALFGIFFVIRADKLSAQLKSQKSNYEKIDKENLENKNNYNKVKEDNAKLQLELQRVAQEKDAAAAQVRNLLPDRQRVHELEDSLAKIKKDTEALTQEKQELLDRSLLLKGKVKDLETIQKQLIKEREQLKQDVVREMDKSGIKSLERENASLKKENSDLASNLGRIRSEADKLKQGNSQLKQDLDNANEKLVKFNKDYSEAVKKNVALEHRVSETPGKFAEIARQNKVLIRQTANMHYNLGVFYTKEKEYSRAAAEFEKAIELTPDDAYSHFNLGYIYAEYLVDRQKAIDHFREYLRLAKKDDKDIDWVKNYIITWQTWEGKKPLE